MLCAHVESHRCSKFVKLAKTVSGREVIEFEEKYLRVTKQKGTEISKEIILKKTGSVASIGRLTHSFMETTLVRENITIRDTSGFEKL